MVTGKAKFAMVGRLVRVLRSIRTDMPLQQCDMFLQICMREGVTFTELAGLLGLSQGTISRNAKLMSVYQDDSGDLKGLDLITLQPDVVERRRLGCHLSPRGREVREQLQAILEGK